MANHALEQVLRRSSRLYATERRAVADRVYALLRRQRLVDFLVEATWPPAQLRHASQRDRLRFAVARLLEGEAASPVAADLGLRGPDVTCLARALERRGALAELDDAERFAIEHSLPDFFAERLRAQLGPEATAAAEAMNVRAPLTVRVNTLKIDRAGLQRALATEGVEASPTRYSPFGLVLDTRQNAYALRSFKDGLFEIQDEGSQLLGMLVDAPPRRCIDTCAGAGGKTLQLAAQMKNRGELFAFDVDERRLGELKLRARRAGVHNCRIHVVATEGPAADASIEAFVGSAERVLVDAPCSGSGTFRRKPDARYKLDAQRLAEHVARQETLLERFARLVKPGGRLVYGTCSILREENEAVVEGFLARHDDFTVAPADRWLGGLASELTVGGFLRLAPHRHGTDGFFGAVLQRR